MFRFSAERQVWFSVNTVTSLSFVTYIVIQSRIEKNCFIADCMKPLSHAFLKSYLFISSHSSIFLSSVEGPRKNIVMRRRYLACEHPLLLTKRARERLWVGWRFLVLVTWIFPRFGERPLIGQCLIWIIYDK
jgi:hypothetical protein